MAEMPERVAPAEGAEEVEFPWTEATAAVAALNAARWAIDDQYFVRPRADANAEPNALGSWQGQYRGDFDAGYGDVTTAAGNLTEQLSNWAGAIVDGAYEANELQMKRNYEADTSRQHGHVM